MFSVSCTSSVEVENVPFLYPGQSPLASITFVYLLAISTAVRDLKPYRGRVSPELTIHRKPSLPLTYYGM